MKRLAFLLLFSWLAPAAVASGFAERPEVHAFIMRMAQEHGFPAQTLSERFAAITPLPRVLELIAPPADPRQRSWRAYRARFLDSRRIAHGLAFWHRHAATLARAEALTSVPAEIIVAILGIETFYGQNTGRFPTFAALATLAFDYPPRAELFLRELEAFLLLARESGRDPASFRGSYAGALGLPQFLPSSIRAYALDFDGDGHIDLERSAPDAIGSVANFLAVHGWRQGEPVAVKVGAGETADVAPLLAEGIAPKRLPTEFASFGIEIPIDAPERPAALIDLVTPDAPTEYWLGYGNFYVLTRYNRSSFYAMAVCQLADALRARRQETQSRLPSPRPACSS